MIILELKYLVFFYLLSSAIVILLIWIYSEHKRGTFKRVDTAGEYIWQCSICSNKYIDSKHEEISTCPVCGSYNKKGEEVR